MSCAVYHHKNQTWKLQCGGALWIFFVLFVHTLDAKSLPSDKSNGTSYYPMSTEAIYDSPSDPCIQDGGIHHIFSQGDRMIYLCENKKFYREKANIFGWLIKFFAIIGTLATIVFGAVQLRNFNNQRKDELKWKKSSKAKEIMDSFLEDTLSRHAEQMLDWSPVTKYILDEKYRVVDDKASGEKELTYYEIDSEIMLNALRLPGEGESITDGREKYIRDCFDAFFGYMSSMEYDIQRNLIEFEDVEYPTNYYVRKMTERHGYKEKFEKYINEYGFQYTIAFLNRFSKNEVVWRRDPK